MPGSRFFVMGFQFLSVPAMVGNIPFTTGILGGLCMSTTGLQAPEGRNLSILVPRTATAIRQVPGKNTCQMKARIAPSPACSPEI